MCSIEDSPIIFDEVKIKPEVKICIKCKTSTATILIRHSTYCKPCFQHVFVGKFRKNMEKYKTSNSKIDEKVMIGLSGGPSSRAMLHLLSEIFSHELSKKQSFTEVWVCHIDENSIFNLKDSTINQVEQIVQKYNSLFIGLRIEDIYSDEFTSNMEFGQVLKISIDKSKQQEFNEFNATIRQNKELSNKEKLQSLLECISNLTSKEDFVWYLKLSLLIQTARKKGCTRLFLGDCSTRLATKIISLTSKGRGSSLPIEILGENNYFGDVIISRPMKDMISKEIGLYNHYLGFETVFIPSLTSLQPSKSSIERLTEDFIVGLERDYPSTVSTIARTGSKLTISNSIDDENRCALCLMPYRNENKFFQNRITLTKIPSSISTTNDCNTATNNCNDHCNPVTVSCSQSCCSDCIKPTKLDHQNIEINNTLCHACRVNMRDINEIFLPPYVAEEAKRQNRRLDLRKNIEEFLIDDIDDDQ
ncbi:hypothetical protein Glove_209g99 [Diversispora epigaea]|uniref:Cytoplasmic tRNA 2-thiolation protein 2 n=1 Tax=Diversispora epigaea TaxID=1348612 RepID=A0A397IIL5_9GLOM|nr:hypothetical protein Glove_209g99 [Diversispora epigaea]